MQKRLLGAGISTAIGLLMAMLLWLVVLPSFGLRAVEADEWYGWAFVLIAPFILGLRIGGDLETEAGPIIKFSLKMLLANLVISLCTYILVRLIGLVLYCLTGIAILDMLIVLVLLSIIGPIMLKLLFTIFGVG